MIYRGFSLLTVLALCVSLSFAQPVVVSEVEDIHPPVESVLQHVPSGSLGFVVVNDIEQAVTNIGDFASNFSPDMDGESMMQMMLMRMELGEGFNPTGGFAVVLLDPDDFEFNFFDSWMEASMYDPYGAVLEEEGYEDEEADDLGGEDTDESSKMVPAVFFVPGTSYSEIFPNNGGELVDEGEVTKILPEYDWGTVFFTANQGSYVLLSPNKQAITSVRNATDYAEMGLSQKQIDAINSADGAAFVDMTIAGPMIVETMEQFMEMAAEDMPADGPYTAEDLEKQMDSLAEQLEQMDHVLASYSVADKGIFGQMSLGYAAGSDQAKLLAATPDANGNLLNWLPDNHYIFAMGTVVNQPESMKEMYLENLEESLAMAVYFQDETKEQILAMADANYGTSDLVQMAIGGAPEGEGLFSVVVVSQCDDAQAEMAGLADEVALMQAIVDDLVDYMKQEIPEFAEFLDDAGEDGEPVTVVDLTVEQTDLSLKGIPLSKVVIDVPLLKKMLEEEMGDTTPLAAILNKDLFTVWIAPVDDTHVALVYGGGTNVMSQVIDAVNGTGTTIADDEGLQAVLAELPDNPQAVIAFSLGNLGAVAGQFQGMIEAEQGGYPNTFPLFYMEETKPFVMTMNVEDNAMTASVFLDTDVFVDIMDSMGRAQQAMMQYYQEMNAPQDDPDGPVDEDTVEPEDEDF